MVRRRERAFIRFSEMRLNTSKLGVIRYNAAASACEKGRQWRRVLRLRLAVDASPLPIRCCYVQALWEVLLVGCAGCTEGDVAYLHKARGDCMQRVFQCLCEGLALGA